MPDAMIPPNNSRSDVGRERAVKRVRQRRRQAARLWGAGSQRFPRRSSANYPHVRDRVSTVEGSSTNSVQERKRTAHRSDEVLLAYCPLRCESSDAARLSANYCEG